MNFNTKFPSLVLEHLKEDTHCLPAELSYTIDGLQCEEIVYEIPNHYEFTI